MSRRIPTLETERLRVRELALDDLDAVHGLLGRAFGSPVPLDERRRWLEWTVLGYAMFANLQQPHYGERAIVLRETGQLVGAVGVVPYLERFDRVAALPVAPAGRASAEVGLFWAVDPAHQGQGFAPEAARALVDHLFAEEQLGRVIATTDADNLASQRVMEKLGMTLHRLEPPEARAAGDRGAGAAGGLSQAHVSRPVSP
ncbi:MAG: GNAT family N-acetyltransferase [Chloroflexi bacterium]|nr:GNAT family N-acetyltransferase [Chloroflexota bacterium]